MGRHSWVSWGLALALLAGGRDGAAAAEQAADTKDVVTITLKDGGTLVGTVVAEDDATLTLRTASGAELKLPREAIASRAAPPPPGEAFTRPRISDPNESRLMFAPTGRPLGKGNGYFSDHYVLFPGFAYGLTDNLSLSGGISTIPGVGLSQQIFYVSATSGWKIGDKTALAIGGFFGAAQADEVLDFGAAALYGVATFGPPDASLSLGLAAVATRQEDYEFDERGYYVRTERRYRFHEGPVLMVGGSLRLGRSISLISENWLVLDRDFDAGSQPFGLALRFFNGRLSADVGVVLVADVLEEGMPVPWLSFSYHFGPSRNGATSSRRPATPTWAAASARARR